MNEQLNDEWAEIARSRHAGMLHDTERNKKYFHAIQNVIEKLSREGRKDITVLDIGTGTGILSMMAASAISIHVTACEIVKPMADQARKIVEENGFADTITVVNKSSTNLQVPTDMFCKADVLVMEIFDTELIGEGVIPTLDNAHGRILSDNCKVIPSSANVFVQLIESNRLHEMNKMNASHYRDVNFPDSFKRCSGLPSPYEVQISQLYPDKLKLLSDSKIAKHFDFTKKYSHNTVSASGGKCSRDDINITTTADGTVHAILLWWELALDEDITLSMAPVWACEDYRWRDHWMQAVYYLPTPQRVVAGVQLNLSMMHDDYTVWFNLKLSDDPVSNLASSELSSSDVLERPLCTCRLHLKWSRERFSMINNQHLISVFDALSTHISHTYNEITIVGENSMLTYFFRNKDINTLSYLECSEAQNKLFDIAKLANNKTKVYRLDCNSLPQNEIIVADPHFSSSMLPWHNLHIWDAFTTLRTKVNKNVILYPCQVLLKACVVSLKDLWKVASPVNEICSFDLRSYDKLINDALSPQKFKNSNLEFSYAEPYAMWEFKNKILSEIVTLRAFDLSEDKSKSGVFFDGEIKITCKGSADCAVVWVDFVYPDNMVTWSTGLSQEDWVTYSKQGLVFMKERKVLSAGETVKCNAVFLPEENEIMFNFM